MSWPRFSASPKEPASAVLHLQLFLTKMLDKFIYFFNLRTFITEYGEELKSKEISPQTAFCQNVNPQRKQQLALVNEYLLHTMKQKPEGLKIHKHKTAAYCQECDSGQLDVVGCSKRNPQLPFLFQGSIMVLVDFGAIHYSITVKLNFWSF